VAGIDVGVVELRGLVVTGFCGALPEEQERPQPLEVDFDLEVDITHALQSDALEDAVDYGRAEARRSST